jgi:hypothetical protein
MNPVSSKLHLHSEHPQRLVLLRGLNVVRLGRDSNNRKRLDDFVSYFAID